ncbi:MULTISPECIES: hypothetical protein [Edwardsiella]|uniref:Uncharacterized protein n=2 Tax=Edwardsiella anguillarum TaxID=1821960 RepID=A0A076LU92_9GAMM|nr:MULTISPECIES: hypothetical protein [Edwardsiella]AIJ10018.1 Hypothetical protein ETEE_3598 [Edwardsiella anguillarum ET080813]AKR77653.1 hypothetical protein AAZ33_08210 [Edwardsiella sp. LADL05-105]KAB0589772.1 hypothetical protein F7P84_13750 [Edwardsiella anguillarum]UOU80733.1 hypothetical protein MUN71_09310 [Edwardsiella anguillarum]WHP81786.1 hypothetical protein MQ090_08135 [Edwardsiella anguillarum]
MLAEIIKRCLNNDAGCQSIYHSEKIDPLAEVSIVINLWEINGEIKLLLTREDDLIPSNGSVCPECWIKWEVLNAEEVGITPRYKSFISECQQNYWLKQQLLLP